MINYIAHNEIEPQRWDDCIMQSENRLPYALSWWLDAVCPEWDALIEDDYKAVMPLTWNRKLGIDYLYQPYFTQQLGVFSTLTSDPGLVSRFLEAIPARFSYIDIHLNSNNQPVNREFRYVPRRNFTLDLSISYIQLFSNYHRSFRRNVNKAVHSDLIVKPGPGPSVFAAFIQKCLNEKLTNLRKNFHVIQLKIINATIQNKTGKILGVYNHAGELLAAGLFVEAAGRYTLLVSASTPAGKKQLAMYLLVDYAIREKAESGLIFDFEGSNIPGIAFFNSGFGSKESFYSAAIRNNLPWPLRLIKR
jgi:hypothetical protein